MPGSLSQDTLPGVIRSLYLDRKSGILHLEREGIKKRIYFKKGSMIFANSDVNDDRIGEFLIRNDALDRDAFEMAVKVAKDTGKRFGKTVVEMGHMTAEEMQTQVTGQIEAIIYSLFLWEAGDWNVEPHEDPVDADIVLNLSTADIILEGIRRMNDLDGIRRGLGDAQAMLRHSDNPLLLYQKISLTPSEGFVLSRVDGVSTVSDIAAISPLGDEETLRCIYGLVSAGVLDVVGSGTQTAEATAAGDKVDIPVPEAETLERDRDKAAAPPAPSGPTPEEQAIRDDIMARHASLATATLYDLLGLRQNAGASEIKKAYYKMAKKYHPDRHHSPYLYDVHGQLEELFVKTTKAYQKLSDPLARRRYDASLRTEAPRGEAVAGASLGTPLGDDDASSKPDGPTPQEKMANMQFQEGRRHFMEMHYFDAIQCLREAVRLASHKGQYHKLLAQALIKNPHWRKEAEEHFHEALKTNQFDAECFAGLGEIYEGEGMKSRAIKMFQQALNYDPSNEFAQEKLDAHKPQGALKGLKGMLRRKKDKEEKEEKISGE